ncbi:alkaline phosphatase family protein [Thermosipho ferrireducens]|uniref:Alkaline phosphatase family protein n=1 Tax=Thermosipho ferrireducens TaxID=2571116 RepID=A0ABX7S757_9BACT|nr:alkaline phosphatase family protein [Thermosipho ferrireducens]QTA38422.1 alkaline phosphatase family protein [Thermosipho ferrireducens]
MSKKVAVIGLDCADPVLMFEEFWDELYNIQKIAKSYGPLRSTIPPITVPAWMSMVTSKDPGELGIYGFRNRKDYSYDSVTFANSRMIKDETIWDTLSKKGYKSIVLSVPLTYPPKKLNGNLVTSFLTPGTDVDFTYPKELKKEIKNWVGEYMFDVENFRTNDKDRLLKDIYKMTEKRFEVAKHLVTEKEWDFFMMVEIGVDRMHHAFWAHHDSTHFKHDPDSPYKSAIRDYYKYIDKKIGELVSLFPDDTVIIITSDHGIQKMDGGIAINDWLIEKGYLVLKERPEKPTRIGKLISDGMIDWSKTKAWGMGGYYGRLFINVEGREPNGIVKKEEYESFRDQLIKELENITDEQGNNIGTRVFKPEEVYKEVRNIAPDLIIYFGNLKWRSMGTVGNESIWLHENDTGPDDANHAVDGIVISSEGDVPGEIYDIRNFVLNYFL